MIPLICDPRDIWPDDVPIGTFHIEDTTVEGYPGATAHILYVCPNGRRCGVLLGPVHIDRPTPDKLPIWGWDGDHTCPSITPSIDCRTTMRDGSPSGGCGWHGHIVNGAFC